MQNKIHHFGVFLIILLGFSQLVNVANAAEKTDSITINENSWDYLQLNISENYTLSISISASIKVSILVFNDTVFTDNNLDGKEEINRSLPTVTDGNSNGPVLKFKFKFTADENTVLYMVFINDNNEDAEIDYTFNFESTQETVSGFSLILIMCISFITILFLFFKNRNRKQIFL